MNYLNSVKASVIKAKGWFENFSADDPGGCLTAGSEAAESVDMAEELSVALANLESAEKSTARSIATAYAATGKLVKQRAELLAALKVAADWLGRMTRIDDLEQAEDARAVIASVEKGGE